MKSCGAIYAAGRCACGHSPVLWYRLTVATGQRIEFWRCDCGVDHPRGAFKAKRRRP